MHLRTLACSMVLILTFGSTAQAATFCAKTGNQLNQALETAGVNLEDDVIKVATGTHITDRYAPGDYQWKFAPGLEENFQDSLTLSGGWDGANNCQTQISLDPASTVLDARYWGAVFEAQMITSDFSGTLNISNLTFYRGEAIGAVSDAGIVVISSYGFVNVDNILVTGNRSGDESSKIGSFSMNHSGILTIRNSQFLNNSFTHSNSGGLTLQTINGAEGRFTNNSIGNNTATRAFKGLEAEGLFTLSNNAVGENTSTANPSYDFKSDVPLELTLVNNHFQTSLIENGAPASQVNTTSGDPGWTLVGTRLVPDAVSALRDSGENSPLGGVPTYDHTGQPRVANLVIDRGAVEANAPPAVPTGPLVEALSPVNGSTTVLEGTMDGEFVSTELTFNVSGGVAPGTTKVECSVTSGTIGLGSTGDTLAVGGSLMPILVGFNVTPAPQEGVITCEITRDNYGISYLVYNFVGVLAGSAPLAVFDSVPKKSPDPASTITLTGGSGVPVGTDVFGESLTLLNTADFGSSDMQVFCQPGLDSDPQITVTPFAFNGDLIAPQGSLQVDFDCDTTVAGNYVATYSCNYDLDDSQNPNATDGTADYTVQCDVLGPPATVVAPTPADGTLTSMVVAPGGTANYEVIFAEVGQHPTPPADAFLLNCYIDGVHQAWFTIDSPAFPGGPYPIVAPATQTVQVTGTDDGSYSLYSANLRCDYADTGHTNACEDCAQFVFPLEMIVEEVPPPPPGPAIVEDIPALDRYTLALLALFLLGAGLTGLRRRHGR